MDDKDTALAKDDALPTALSGAIEGILAHPELISMVASALGKAPPDSASASSEPPPSVSQSSETPSMGISSEAIATLAPLLSGLTKGTAPLGKKDDPRACLLLALKPYLSAGRCEAIDTMLRLSALSDALRSMHHRT